MNQTEVPNLLYFHMDHFERGAWAGIKTIEQYGFEITCH